MRVSCILTNALNISEHVISIIASMLRNCKGPQRQRLMSKFTENDFEKVDRLMELHFKYLEKVEEVEKDAKVRHNDNRLYVQYGIVGELLDRGIGRFRTFGLPCKVR